MEDGNTNAVIWHAVQALTRKMDEQTELLKSFDRRIKANTTAAKEKREGICMLQKKFDILHRENNLLKEAHAEQTHYKRRWNLRMIGLTEEDGEDRTPEKSFSAYLQELSICPWSGCETP